MSSFKRKGARKKEKSDSQYEENRVLSFGPEELKEFQAASLEAVKNLRITAVHIPAFKAVIGHDVVALEFHGKTRRINLRGPAQNSHDTVERYKNGQPKRMTPVNPTEIVDNYYDFKSKKGTAIINYLMVVIPSLYKSFKETDEYKRLCSYNLKGRLLSKARMKDKMDRATAIMAAIKMADIYVVVNGKNIGLYSSLEREVIEARVLKLVESDNHQRDYELREGVKFYVAKDCRINQLSNSSCSLFATQSANLEVKRFAKQMNRKQVTIPLMKEIREGNVVTTVEVPTKAYIVDELANFDGSDLPSHGEEIDAVILNGIFQQVHVLHRENGVLKDGEDVTEENAYSYFAATRSSSKERKSSSMAYRSIEDVATFFLGGGMTEKAFSEIHLVKSETEYEVKDGMIVYDDKGEPVMKMVPSGYRFIDVGKAYKRFNANGSSGADADKGLLSRFQNPKELEIEFIPEGQVKVEGGLSPAYIKVTNKFGEKLTIAVVKDFYTTIKEGNRFLLNVLNEDKAFTHVEEFKHWENALARKILRRNNTDGQGYHNERFHGALREAGLLNSRDAFQSRAFNPMKGASFRMDEIPNLFQADLVITEGMIKSGSDGNKAKAIYEDLKEHGFHYFIVGQRKDGPMGVQAASQGLQQVYLTAEELQMKVDETISFVMNSVDNNLANGLLALLGADSVETESEFNVIDFVRMGEEFGDILDEQYIRDQIVGLAVKKLNHLLNGKVFVPFANTSYMFTDPFAILDAAKAGRYEVMEGDGVLNPFEIIHPSITPDGKYAQTTGMALTIRYPLTVTHETPVVKAVYSERFQEYIEQGLWQGCVFFDAFSWIVAMQAGADHDGDGCMVCFDATIVNARIRKGNAMFGGLPVLPFIDVYVRYDKDGNPIEFNSGCPDYIAPSIKIDGTTDKQISEAVKRDGFVVKGRKIYYDPDVLEGENGEQMRFELMKLQAEVSREITLASISKSLIGIIANRAMILTDWLSRDTLSPANRIIVENDMLKLTAAGRFEIDRPKYGGAYTEMPIFKALFEKFDSYFFSEDEMSESLAKRKQAVMDAKGIYFELFSEVKVDGDIIGYRIKKPQWLAAQKDEDGIRRKSSPFQQVFGTRADDDSLPLSYSEKKIIEVCNKYKSKHSNKGNNNIVGRILENMELEVAEVTKAKALVDPIYQVFSAKERARQDAEKYFRQNAEDVLVAKGYFNKMRLNLMTKAKRTAKIRVHYEAELKRYSLLRDVNRAELRKEMYKAASLTGYDVRVFTGALYLLTTESGTKGKSSYVLDGKEYRFVPSNGNISLAFEVMKEEMSSLISGKVSEAIFIPTDLSFTLVRTEYVVQTRVTVPDEKFANGHVTMNAPVRVAIRPENQNGTVKQVMYFLKKGVAVTDEKSVSHEDAAFVGFAPANFKAGMYTFQVADVLFTSDAKAAHVRFSI